MKLLVLGATGGTGREVTSQALASGHDVTVMVRDPARLSVPREKVHLFTGSLPKDAGTLTSALRGQDAVVSALGTSGSLKSGNLMARSVPVLVTAMEQARVSRIVFTSAFGVGDTWQDVPVVPRIFLRLLLRDIYADKAEGEAHLQRSALDWTLVYPSTLTNGKATGRYRAGEHLPLRGMPRLSRADLAAFLLAHIDDRTYVRKHVLVSG